MQPNNPEALEDTKEVYRDPAHGATLVKQDIAGGGTVVQTVRSGDEEAYPGGGGYQQQQQTTTTTTGGTSGGVYTAPTVGVTVRRDVRPSPRAGGPGDTSKDMYGGGFLGNVFTTKGSSRFFFSLHAAIVFFAFLVFVSSALVENNAPVTGPGSNLRFVQYQLSTAQVSIAVSLGALVMERLGLLENRNLRVALSAFQVFFWVPALVIMTFFGSFISPLITANGFFGAWGALAASTVVFMHEAERSRRDPRMSSAPRASLLLMLFFSLMVMGSGIRLYNQFRTPQGFNDPENPFSYIVFAISFGAITAFLSVVMLCILDTTASAVLAVLGTILWLWVVVGGLVLTFAEPFEAALGNGYYSVLFTMVASFGLFQALRRAGEDYRRNHNAAGQAATTTNNPRAVETRSSQAFFSHIRVMTISGLIVMVAAILLCRDTGCGTAIKRFEIAAGAVPLFFGLIVVLLEMFGLYRISAGPKIAFAFIMLLWWIGVFTVLTYFGNYQSPTGTVTSLTFANGYFFTWIGLIVSCLAFAEALKEMALNKDRPNPAIAKSGFLLLVVLGSVITMGMGIDAYYGPEWDISPSLTIYAIALGAGSIFVSIIAYCAMGGLAASSKDHTVHDSVYNAILYFLTIWWAVGALVLTFQNFWSSATNNGYFSVFFTLFACLLALSGIWREDDTDSEWDAHDADNVVRTQGPMNTNSYPTTTAERRV